VTAGPKGHRGLLRSFAVDTTPLRGSLDYRRVWLSQVVSLIGSSMTVIAVPLQVYAVTRSSFLVGVTGFVSLVPLVGFGLLGGAIVDATDRRRLLLGTTFGLLAVSVVLFVHAALHGRSLAVLYSCVAVQGGLLALEGPLRQVITRRLLPTEQIAAATALSQVLMNFGSVAGPLLAGVVVGTLGYPWAYGIDVVSYAAAIYAVWRLPTMAPEGGGRRAGAASVLEGLRYLRTRPVLLSTFGVDLVAMVFGMPRALFPALASGQFHGGARTAGVLYAAPALGALVGALGSGRLPAVRRQGAAVLLSVAVWGGAIAAFGVVTALWAGVLLLALAGAADMVSAVFRNTILIVSTPDAMMGRLGGVFTVVVAGGPRLGDLEAGTVAAAASPGFSVVSGGLACIVGVGLFAALVPKLVRYDARHPDV